MSFNVLIVDDSDVDRSIMSRIISKNMDDVAFYESSDGKGISDIVKNNNIMVCILDLKMPEVDGIEILTELKSNPETQDVPIIVCSGVVETDTLEKVLRLGAYDYFNKPLSEEAMKISLPLKVRNAIEFMRRTHDIVNLSKIDTLTNLYNRNYFKKYIETLSIEKIEFPISILMADINGLKVLNDAYGNHYGDQMLIQVGEIFKKNCPEDAICCRWGGDEFAILLQNVTKNEVDQIIIKIKKAVILIEHEGLHLSIAFGSETTQGKNLDISKLLVNAEDAMFRDKILEDISIRSNMIATIIHTLNEKNPREEAHSRRVSELCEKMGEALNLDEKEIRDLRVIGLLHDIGKIAIDEHVLNKPGKLTEEEWLEMKRHPEIGCRLLSASKEMSGYTKIILAHHERYDGTGYPNGLAGNNIPFFSRILSIMDSFDAMTCERPYKKTITTIEAAKELLRYSDIQFDSGLVQVFVSKVLDLEIDKIR